MQQSSPWHERFRRAITERPALLPFLFAVLSFCILLPATFFVDLPRADVWSRYAPMAEAFARGDWEVAFHPRIPPFLPVTGGCIAKILGCSGFTAVKIAGVLIYSLTFLALIPLFRRIFDLRTTIVAGFLAIVGSHMMRLVISGLRESAKTLFMTCAAYALVRLWQEKKSTTTALILGISCGLMAYVRDDCVLYAMLFLFAAFLMEIFHCRLIPWRTIVLSGITMLVMLTPLLTLNYCRTGYPVPSNRFLPIAQKIMPPNMFHPKERGQIATTDYGQKIERTTKESVTDQGEARTTYVHTAISGQKPIGDIADVPEVKMNAANFFKMLWNMLDGCYLYYVLPALAVIFLRIRKGCWTKEETLLLTIPVGHTLLQAVQIVLADHWFFFPPRYATPLSPLFCGWTAMAALFCYDYAGKIESVRSKRNVIVAVLAVLAFIAMYADGLGPEIRNVTSTSKRERHDLLFRWAKLIREDYKGPADSPMRHIFEEKYYSSRMPRVFSGELEELGYLSGGEGFTPVFGWDPKDAFLQELNNYAAKFIEWDMPMHYLAEELPDNWQGAAPEIAGYRIMDEFRGKKHRYVLWKLDETTRIKENGQ